MEGVCRACLENRVTLVNISSEVRDPTLEQPERKISYILSECTNRLVERNDGHPQYICMQCVEAAQHSFSFKRQCDRSFERYCKLQKKCSPQWEPEGHQDQNRQEVINQEGRQIEDSRADAFQSYSSPPNASSSRESLSLSPNGTKTYHASIMSETVQTRIKEVQYVKKSHECSHCFRTYTTRNSLNRHIAVHVSKPKHKCPHCPRTYFRTDSFHTHLHKHDKDGPYCCSQCPSVFTKAVKLELHRQEHKVDMTNMENSLDASPKRPALREPLPRLSSTFTRENSRRTSPRKQSQRRQSTVDKNTADKSTTPLLGNLGLSSPDLSLANSKIDDSSIGSSDDNPSSMRFDHDTTSSGQGENPVKKRFGCPQCQRSYTDKKDLKRHLATHTSKPKYTCSVCSQAFWRKYRYTRHVRTHKEEGPISCSQCTAVFIDVFNLKKHCREHQEKTVGSKRPVPDDFDSEENDDDSENNDIEMNNGETSLEDSHESLPRHSSDLFSKSSIRKDGLRVRKIVNHHHTGDKNSKKSTTLFSEWEAQSLDLSVESSMIDESSIESTDYHPTSSQNKSRFDQDTTSPEQEEKQIKMYNTEKRFKCKQCSRTYKHKRGMERHQETHKSEPKHICSQCPRTFQRYDYLMRHLRTHGPCKYSCDQCSAEFFHNDTLTRHYRNIHQIRSYVKCNYCSKELRDKNSLKRHERLHTGELFRCRFCPKGYTEPCLLRRHERNNHETEINALSPQTNGGT